MVRHPLIALLLLIAAWTQVLAPMMMTCARTTAALDQIPICHAGTPTPRDEGTPAAPVHHDCMFCVACHAMGSVPRPAPVVTMPLQVAVVASWQVSADPVLRREAFTRARARSPPALV